MITQRLWAIDPGSDKVGLASAEVDFAAKTLHIERTLELNASRVLVIDRAYADIADYHGERFARQCALADLFERELRLDPPQQLISESPFIHIRSHAYAALIETLQALRLRLHAISPWLGIEFVAPTAAKAKINAANPEKSGKKEFILSQLQYTFDNDENASLADEVDLHEIGEHCVDAIVIAYYYYAQYVKLSEQN